MKTGAEQSELGIAALYRRHCDRPYTAPAYWSRHRSWVADPLYLKQELTYSAAEHPELEQTLAPYIADALLNSSIP